MSELTCLPNEVFLMLSENFLWHDRIRNQPIITKDDHGVSAFRQIHEVMIDISQNRDVLFTFNKSRRDPRIIFEPLGERLFDSIVFHYNQLRHVFVFYEFDPLIEGFMQYVRSHESLALDGFFYCRRSIFLHVPSLCKGLKQCAKELHELTNSRELSAQIERRQHDIQQLTQGLLTYVDHLFERYEYVHVIRMELSFLTPSQCQTRNVEIEPEPVTFDEALDYCESFRQSLATESLFEHLIGHVWKLEHGPCKGFQSHWVFFFDGLNAFNAQTLPDLIGEHWENVVGFQAMYWNCHRYQSGYRRLGVGLIGQEYSSRHDLTKALEALCQVEYYIRLRHPSNRPTFGWGERQPLPEITASSTSEATSDVTAEISGAI